MWTAPTCACRNDFILLAAGSCAVRVIVLLQPCAQAHQRRSDLALRAEGLSGYPDWKAISEVTSISIFFFFGGRGSNNRVRGVGGLIGATELFTKRTFKYRTAAPIEKNTSNFLISAVCSSQHHQHHLHSYHIICFTVGLFIHIYSVSQFPSPSTYIYPQYLQLFVSLYFLDLSYTAFFHNVLFPLICIYAICQFM